MKNLVVIGGGAAGFFGAIVLGQEVKNKHHVYLLEKNRQVLAKVRISGGGRCNVTHACFDPKKLVQFYPRGSKELLGPFSRFQPQDTIRWFASRGVKLKTEEDGRMFPESDSSETIIDCLIKEAKKQHVELFIEQKIQKIEKEGSQFRIEIEGKEPLVCEKLLLATGSQPQGHAWAKALGHTIIDPVPSLFTFTLDSEMESLAGISVPHVKVKAEGFALQQEGPLLITHHGFSGPAILKLSAWGARHFHQIHYQTNVIVNWIPEGDVFQMLSSFKQEKPQWNVTSGNPFALPKQLWKKLVEKAGLLSQKKYVDLSNKELQKLKDLLTADCYKVVGKSTYKEEFVTCGGVDLKEIDFKTMQSKLCPGLYFAGEILNIDGVTGGFNFQNAWTTGWIAGHGMGFS